MTARVYYRHDEVSEMLRGPAAALESALQLLKEEEEIHFEWPSRRLFRRAAAITQAEGTPDARAGRALMHGLLGNHPYATPVLVKDVLKVSKEQVRAWWQTHFRPDNAILVVVGDVDGPAVIEAARDALGSWRAPSSALGPPAPPPSPRLESEARAGNVIITHRPGAVQAEITFACLLPPARGSDVAAQDLFMDVVGRDLWRELRESLGATYGVGTARNAMRGGLVYMTVHTEVDHRHLPAALAVLRRYWDDDAQLSRQSAIDDARREASRGSLTKFDTTARVAREIFEYWNLGWPIDDIEKYEDRLAAVPAAALPPVLDVCRANSVLSIVGDEPTIRAAWQQQ